MFSRPAHSTRSVLGRHCVGSLIAILTGLMMQPAIGVADDLVESAPILSVNVPVRTWFKENRLEHLPRTKERLLNKGAMNWVVLGDSIIIDTFRNPAFSAGKINAALGTNITINESTRGGTGVQYYQDPANLQTYVIDKAPDLLLIGGISNNDDLDAMRSVINQTRAALPDVEIVLISDAVNQSGWATVLPQPAHLLPSDSTAWRAKLYLLSDEMDTGFIDARFAWNTFSYDAHLENPSLVYGSQNQPGYLQRDRIHANTTNGSEVLGTTIANFFTVPEPASALVLTVMTMSVLTRRSRRLGSVRAR